MFGASATLNAMTRWVKSELRKAMKWRHDTLDEIDLMIRNAGLSDDDLPRMTEAELMEALEPLTAGRH
jgi:NADP-dependent 3-hydroxy acid dehydrogenase YdfG